VTVNKVVQKTGVTIMAKRHFNWSLLVILLVGMVAVAAGVFSLRQWQRRRVAEMSMREGLAAFEKSEFDLAADNLGHYLGIEQTSTDIMLKYAQSHMGIRPLQRSNVLQAIATYRAILRMDNQHQQAAIKLTELYIEMDSPAEAELIAIRYLASANDPKIARLLAISLAKQNKILGAASQLRRTIEDYPAWIPTYETLARLTDRYPEKVGQSAQYWLDKAIEANPSSAEALIVRAAFYLDKGQGGNALTDLQQAESLGISGGEDSLRAGNEFAQALRYDKARQYFMTVSRSEPDSLSLWLSWADLAMQIDSKDEMVEVAENALAKLGFKSVDFMPMAAELFIKAGETSRAADCIKELKAMDRKPVAVAYIEGLLAESQKHYHDAIKFWRKAVLQGDKSERTRLLLAEAMNRGGDLQSQLQQLRNLVSEQPGSFKGHFQLALALGRIGNISEALDHANWAVKISPDDIDARVLYNKIRMMQAENFKTGEEQVLHEVEQDTDALAARTRDSIQVKLSQFQIAMRRKRYDQAESILKEIDTNGDMPLEVELAEVELLSATGRADKAITKLYSMIKQIPQNVIPIKYLAALSAGHGSREDCEAVLKDAIGRIEDPIARSQIGLIMASFYDQWGEGGKSLQLLETLSSQLPFDISIRRRLLKYDQVIKDPIKAQQIVDSIRTIEGLHGWQWRYEQAKILYNAENFKVNYSRITDLLKENLTANSQDATSRMLLGASYEKAGEYEMALAVYRQALSHNADDMTVIATTAALLYKMGKYDQADEILTVTTKNNISDSRLSNLQMRNNIKQGKLSSAEIILTDLVAKDPNNQSMMLSLALLRTQMGKFNEAEKILADLKIQYPESMPVIAAFVQLNMKWKRYDQAITLCNEAIQKFNDATAYVLRGQVNSKFGRKDIAAADFDRAVLSDPYNANTWIYRSIFYKSEGKIEKAIEDIQRALSLDPENLQAQKQGVMLLMTSSDPKNIQQAERLLDRNLARHPEDIELRMFKAGMLLSKGNGPSSRRAKALLQSVTDDRPDDVKAWAMLARIHIKNAVFGKAMDTILRGLTYLPNDRSLLLLKAQAEAHRSPELAIPTLKMLLRRDPEDVEVAVQLARMYVAAMQTSRAIDLLSKWSPAVTVKDNQELFTVLAIALYNNGDVEKSGAQFEKLYSTLNDSGDVFIAEMQMLLNDGKFGHVKDKAINRLNMPGSDISAVVRVAAKAASIKSRHSLTLSEHILKEVIAENPRSVEALLTLGLVLHVAGSIDDAAAIYERVVDIDPGSVVAVNNLAWMMCEEQGKHAQALELASTALQKAPDYIDLLDTRGVIYYRMGDYKKAVEDFTRCVNLHPRQSTSLTVSYFHLARALAAANERHKAIESMEKALEMHNRLGGLSLKDLAEAKVLRQQLLQENSNATVYR
jgi:tetratricopeptide (TPR) repeat protein